MKNDTANEKDNPAEEPIVIADECGDSMWDTVLNQEVKACQIVGVNKNPEAQIDHLENVQECDPDKSGLAATKVK